MNAIDVFYQGEGIREIEHIEVDAEQTFAVLKAVLAEKHGLVGDLLIFLEDGEDPIEEVAVIRECGCGGGIKAHLHRCRHVEVSVAFNGEPVHHRFSPGTTVARVKRWAAERKFGMSPEEASEHVLQLAGSHDRPAPGTHLGALVACPRCSIAFRLVPNERVNGQPEAEG
jgi:hypothetical protein